ncbi:MAG: minor capsid protein [Acidobacteria bacterium]|nr:minor capsid protein [Acidobacteriota bacterium]
MITIIEAFAYYLDSQSLGIYRTNQVYSIDEWGILLDYMAADPPYAIVITTQEGEAASTVEEYDFPRVQIRIRGTTNPLESRRLAQQIYNSLHGLGPITIKDLEILLCIGLDSGPTYLGRDDNNRHHHAVRITPQLYNPERVNCGRSNTSA